MPKFDISTDQSRRLYLNFFKKFLKKTTHSGKNITQKVRNFEKKKTIEFSKTLNHVALYLNLKSELVIGNILSIL